MLLQSVGHIPNKYRCDVCGRMGFWRSDGFQWMRYGPVEGDGVDTCSEACREKLGDPEAAFRKLIKWIKDGQGCRTAVRKHNRLISEKPPTRRPDDDFPPTSSTTDTIACPYCDNPVSVGDGKCKKCKKTLVIESETVTTHYCTIAARK